jgi:hypothetical protein
MSVINRAPVSAARSALGRSAVHSSLTRCSMVRNPSMPPRFSGGRYEAPRNGFRSAVRNTDIGQPPESIVWT